MFPLIEPLILYFVLFFPGTFNPDISTAAFTVNSIPFSAFREASRTLAYTIPALSLIWYLILDKKSLSPPGGGRAAELSVRLALRVRRRDFFPFLAGFPCLVLFGVVISLLNSLVAKTAGMPTVEPPGNAAGWIIMAVSCLGTGYLEESYFRFYLLEKLPQMGFGSGMFGISFNDRRLTIAFSSILFALCHVYEGPWGIANATLAGVFLSILYQKYRSLHGIAWAHGAYNAFVYVMGLF
ncbi:MAG: CPBP family intramembrane metalloprotease [Treponema sp.]|jgi:membrane protease YdiL (CAAX protease family)|nr:CPBP family intramembrane metalloprotease [Treponema sp.]